MRVYLDNCCYNRPFDEQAQLSIRHIGSMRVANPLEYVQDVDV